MVSRFLKCRTLVGGLVDPLVYDVFRDLFVITFARIHVTRDAVALEADVFAFPNVGSDAAPFKRFANSRGC